MSAKKLKQLEAEFGNLFGNEWAIKVEDVSYDYFITFQYGGDCTIYLSDNVYLFLDVTGGIHYFGGSSTLSVTVSLERDETFADKLFDDHQQFDGWLDPDTIKTTVRTFIKDRLNKAADTLLSP